MNIEKAVAGIHAAMLAIDLLEHAVKAATGALAKGRESLSDALAELEIMRSKLAEGDAAADSALAAKFDTGE